MSAVNNTLREIILRERPLTVTNNGSLSLSLLPTYFSSCSLSLSLSPCLRLHPFVALCMWCIHSLSPLHSHSSSTKRLHSPCIFSLPSMCTHSKCVNAAGQFQHSNQWMAPEKKNQAVVIRTILHLNWYVRLSRQQNHTGIYCISFLLFYSLTR